MPKKQDRQRLVLLDAHAIIHRAYHALPDFTSPTGEPTGALYGLSSMLLKIIQDLKPDYIAACYDLPKPTLRHEAYADYKAKRTGIDDALATQLTTSRNVFHAFSIPIYEKEGFEADDILGTITHVLKDSKDIEIIIASGDMDTLQLVEKERVKVYTLKKGLNDTIMYDAKAVEERYGFAPTLVPDYKGLRGDPSDNIIGVPGIGEKTATELIQKFGTIEQIYKAISKDEEAVVAAGIKPRIVNLLKEHEEDALFSKMLATIRLDAPIAFKLPDAVWKDGSTLPSVLALFDELGFRTLRARAKALFEHGKPEGSDEGHETDADEEPKESELDPERLEEAKVMVWLLASDLTNPSLDDILAYTKAQTFDAAYKTLISKIEITGELESVYNDIEKPLIPVLKKMEQHGVMIDRKELDRLATAYRAELAAVEKRIYEAAGKEFNVGSPKQLGDVLYDDLGLKVPGAKATKKTATGQRSTKETELEKLREVHPIIDDILEYRQIQKLLGTYIENIPALMDDTDRIHPQFIQTGAVTGRMATTNPSIQNIPIRTERGRAIRHAFIAAPGSVLLALDYSQIELRLAAVLSGDEKLCDIFRSGRDVHTEVAAAVFGVTADNVDREMRRRAKVINFGILYGMGVNALKAQLGTSTSEAHQFYDDYFNTFTRLAEYLEEVKGQARRQGFIETMFGRRREFTGIRSPLPYVRAQAERMAINAPIQGTEADVVKLAMVRIDRMLAERGIAHDAHMILQVHDELVFEMKEELVEDVGGEIRTIMESVISEEEMKGVPLSVQPKVGKNWGEMEEI